MQSSLEASATSSSDEQLIQSLKSLLQVGVEFLSGSHSVQFTGLVLINKIIDVVTATSGRTERRRRKRRRPKASPVLPPPPPSARTSSSPLAFARCKTSRSWRDIIQQQQQQSEQQQPPPAAEVATDARPAGELDGSIIHLLSEKVHAGTVLSLVLNAITLHRRVVGTRFRCTPSLRIRQCSYHCLQILCARLLLYLAQSSVCREQLMKEAQLRMMVEALDYTLDPQLLCLVIQTVALLALHYPYQPLLLSSGIPDALAQLVLPSDEWYYTNHTTRFSRVVKHHAARALVYLGLARCLGPRVSLFDYQGNINSDTDSPSSLPADLWRSIFPICCKAVVAGWRWAKEPGQREKAIDFSSSSSFSSDITFPSLPSRAKAIGTVAIVPLLEFDRDGLLMIMDEAVVGCLPACRGRRMCAHSIDRLISRLIGNSGPIFDALDHQIPPETLIGQKTAEPMQLDERLSLMLLATAPNDALNEPVPLVI